jgi:hypothetical protein
LNANLALMARSRRRVRRARRRERRPWVSSCG